MVHGSSYNCGTQRDRNVSGTFINMHENLLAVKLSYDPVCHSVRSVGWLVGRSVGWSIGLLVGLSAFHNSPKDGKLNFHATIEALDFYKICLVNFRIIQLNLDILKKT